MIHKTRSKGCRNMIWQERAISRIRQVLSAETNVLIEQIRAAARLNGSESTEPNIKLSGAVGQKSHELSIRRDRDVVLVALEVANSFGSAAVEWVPPKVIILPKSPK